MANRRLNQFRYAFEAAVNDIFMDVTFGSSGAPTIARGKGVTSIVRNSAGDYTITLQDNYNGLSMIKHTFINATAPASPSMYVKTNSITSGSVRIVFNSAGTATDPASGERVLIQISGRNSTV
jgi:hypothetical protein